MYSITTTTVITITAITPLLLQRVLPSLQLHYHYYNNDYNTDPETRFEEHSAVEEGPGLSDEDKRFNIHM